MLKHSIGLRLHSLRLLLVVLNGIEGADYMVPVTHFHHSGLDVIITPPEP